ncbi:MAG: alpha/beta fold hydrolase [Longimicrobiaceae bacterium]
MTAPALHHTLVTAEGGRPGRWLLFLHGIYGAGRNWATIARRLVEERPEWGAALADLRMHGRSQGFGPPHTVEAAANDLYALADDLPGGVAAVLGHSFGGKVALRYAADAPEGLKQLWVIDSSPAPRDQPGGSAWEVLEQVRARPAEFTSRAEAVSWLREEGHPAGVAQWLATNLEPEGGRYLWRLDWGVMEEMLRDFSRADLWRLVETPPQGVELHFVYATRGSALDDDARGRLERLARESGRIWLHRLPGGHWLHADNPEGLLELLGSRLP